MRPTIRSQFACTYKEDELPLNRVLEFPSTSQIPTCVHPAHKKANSLDMAVEEVSDNRMDNRFKGRVFAKFMQSLKIAVVVVWLVS